MTQQHKPANPFEQQLGLKPASSRLGLLKRIEQGFEYSIIPYTKQWLGITMAELSELMNVNPRTLVRRRKSGRLNKLESAQLYQLAMLVELAIEVIQDRAAALYWLKTPKRDLEGKVPLDFVQTQVGIDEVKMLLMRIKKRSD